MIVADFSIKRPPAKCKRAACGAEFVPAAKNQEYIAASAESFAMPKGTANVGRGY